jgi:hypothetical protein
MRKIRLSALVLASALAVSGAAQADCCNDFWSCLGAAATAGLSCQIESLIASVTTLKNAVETLGNSLSGEVTSVITQAQQGVSNAASDLKQVRIDAGNELKNSADQARALAHPPPQAMALKPGVVVAQQSPPSPAAAAAKPVKGAVVAKGVTVGALAAPPKPADPKAIKDAFTRADSLVQDLLAKSTNPTNQVNQAAEAALAAAARHLNTARQIGIELTLAPLNALRDSLLDLLQHPERLFDPTAQINADIQRISQQLPAMFDRITNEITQEALADLNQGTSALRQVQEASATGHAVADAMQKVNGSKLQSDLDELNALLPKPAVVVAPAAGALPPPIVTLSPSVLVLHKQRIALALDRANPAKFPIVVQQHAAAANLVAKWQTIQLQIKTPLALAPASAQKVDHDLGQMFVGKKGADAAKKKQEMLDEAAKRFANEPKTLAKVKAYIEAHAPKG